MLRLETDASTTHSGYSLFLSGEELGEVRELFKDFPHHASPFSLEFGTNRLEDILDILNDYEIETSKPTLRAKIKAKKPPLMELVENPIMPTFKLAPHPYQIDAVKYGIQKERFLLGDEPGLGKTGTMIFLSEILQAHYGFKHVLIICGINGSKYNWHQVEIPKFSYKSSHILGGRVNRNNNFVIGDIKERLEDIQRDHEEFYLIINVESLRNKDITEALRKRIVSGEIGMVVFDEIHTCSGRNSAQGKAIHELRPRFRVGLTGTPMSNKPLDVYNLAKWLGYEYKRFDDFAREYCYESPRTIVTSGRVITLMEYIYKDLALFHNKLQTFMLRRTSEIMKLPTPVFKDEYVELDNDQLKVYNKIKEDTLKAMTLQPSLKLTDILNPATSFIKARQCVSAPHLFGCQSDAKLERTIEIVQEAIDNGRNVVVFCWFNATIDSYSSKFKSEFGDMASVVRHDTNNAQEVVSEFQNNPNKRILLGTMGKLGTSFTITKADTVIFVDKHVMWSEYKQSYMRVWRQGQTKTVFIINLMAKNTIDERLSQLVATGRSYADQVVDGVDNSTEYYNQVYNVKDLL